jgi:hypothetical protein
MKLPRVCLGLIFAVTAGWVTADPAGAKPEWRGVIDLDTGSSFLVVAPGETTGNWKKVGDAFGDWTVAAYRPADHILVVQGTNGTKLELVMNSSPATAAAPPDPNQGKANAYAITYLMQRADQLKRDAEAADKELAAFREKHAGADPAQMAAGPLADEANALKTKAEVMHQNYVTILDRLQQTQQNAASPAPPPSN